MTHLSKVYLKRKQLVKTRNIEVMIDNVNDKTPKDIMKALSVCAHSNVYLIVVVVGSMNMHMLMPTK